MEETVAAMDLLVRQGKVLYWGTSEWPEALIREAARFARANQLAGPSMEQPQYNLLHRERVELEYASLYSELGLGTTTWSPLASGLLTGKYASGIEREGRLAQADAGWLQRLVVGHSEERRLDRAQRFVEVATELGERPAPLAIAWCLRNPHVSSVILGASTTAQLLENLSAVELAGKYDEPVWRRLEVAAAV